MSPSSSATRRVGIRSPASICICWYVLTTFALRSKSLLVSSSADVALCPVVSAVPSLRMASSTACLLRAASSSR